MNKKQGITIICAVIVLNLIKIARPAWLDGEEGGPFLGVFNTSTLMFLLGSAALVVAILMWVFRTKNPNRKRL